MGLNNNTSLIKEWVFMPVMFPHEPSQLAAIQKSISRASKDELGHAIELLSCRTDTAAQGVFQSAMHRVDELCHQEMVLNHQICLLHEEINDLAIAKDEMVPDQIDHKLAELRDNIFSCSQPQTVHLRNQLRQLKNEWSHQHFLTVFPIAEELNRDSFQSRVIHRMLDEMEKQPDRADELQKQLDRWQQECQAAEQIFSGRGLGAFRRLPQEFQLAIERRLFEKRLGYSRIETKTPEDRALLAGAIMAVLAEQMTFPESSLS
jgi:hypothetical protein